MEVGEEEARTETEAVEAGVVLVAVAGRTGPVVAAVEVLVAATEAAVKEEAIDRSTMRAAEATAATVCSIRDLHTSI